MICDTCPLREGCSERIGLCNAYLQYQKRVERVQKEIEKLNETEKAPAVRSISADKGSIQKAGDRGGKVHKSPSERVQAETGTDPKEDSETEAEKEAGQRIQT